MELWENPNVQLLIETKQGVAARDTDGEVLRGKELDVAWEELAWDSCIIDR